MELKNGDEKTIQELSSTVDFNELKATVYTLQQKYQHLAVVPHQQRKMNEEEIIARATEKENLFHDIPVLRHCDYIS